MIKFILTVGLLAVLASGCYQLHSDDDLRTVPVTNNPHNLPEGAGRQVLPGMGI